MTEFATLDTSMGTFGIRTSSVGVFRVHLPNDPQDSEWETPLAEQSTLLKQAMTELEQYFKGKRQVFDIVLDLHLSPFYQKILMEVSKIPFGTTVSYRDVAVKAGNPKAVRAAGTANAKNPVPIFIPCHRVLSSDGTLGGYGGGLDLKKRLLLHEGLTIKS
mgnify:FL=1